MSEPASAPRQEWRSSLDPALVARLQQPAVRPGVMRQAMLHGVLSRSMRLSNRVPLLGELSRRMGYDTARGPQTPVVLALPTEPPLPSAPDAPPAPAATQPRAGVPTTVQRQPADAAPLVVAASPAPADGRSRDSASASESIASASAGDPLPMAGSAASAESPAAASDSDAAGPTPGPTASSPAAAIGTEPSVAADGEIIQRTAVAPASSGLGTGEHAASAADEGVGSSGEAEDSALPVVSPDPTLADRTTSADGVEMIHRSPADAVSSAEASVTPVTAPDAAAAVTVEAVPPPKTIARSASGRFMKATPPAMPLAAPAEADQPPPPSLPAPDSIQRTPAIEQTQSAIQNTVSHIAGDVSSELGGEAQAETGSITAADAPTSASDAPGGDATPESAAVAAAAPPPAEIPTVRGTPAGDALATISPMPPLRQIRRTPLASAPPAPQAPAAETPRVGQVIASEASVAATSESVQRTAAPSDADAAQGSPETPVASAPGSSSATEVATATEVVTAMPVPGDSVQRAEAQPLVDAVGGGVTGDQPGGEQGVASAMAASEPSAEAARRGGEGITSSAASPGAVQRSEAAAGANDDAVAGAGDSAAVSADVGGSQPVAGAPVGEALAADVALIHRSPDGGEPSPSGGAASSAIQRSAADSPAASSTAPGGVPQAATESPTAVAGTSGIATPSMSVGSGVADGSIQRSASDTLVMADDGAASGAPVDASWMPVVVGEPASSIDAPVSSAVSTPLVQREDLGSSGNASGSPATSGAAWSVSDTASAAEITVAAMMADAQRSAAGPSADSPPAVESPPVVAAVAPAGTVARDQAPAFVLATGYTAASGPAAGPVVTGSVQRTIREGGAALPDEPTRRAAVVASPIASQPALSASPTPLIQRTQAGGDGDPVQRTASSSAAVGPHTMPAAMPAAMPAGMPDVLPGAMPDVMRDVMPDAIQRAAEPFPLRPPRGDEQAMPLAATEAIAESPPVSRSDAGQVSRAGVVSAAAFQAARASSRGRGLPLVQRATAGRGGQAERGPALTYAARETAEARAAFSGAASALAANAPAMIQREFAALDEGSGSGASLPPQPAPEVAAVAPPEREADGPDVGLIARQVYEILVRRLVSERRQRGW